MAFDDAEEAVSAAGVVVGVAAVAAVAAGVDSALTVGVVSAEVGVPVGSRMVVTVDSVAVSLSLIHI